MKMTLGDGEQALLFVQREWSRLQALFSFIQEKIPTVERALNDVAFPSVNSLTRRGTKTRARQSTSITLPPGTKTPAHKKARASVLGCWAHAR